MVIFRQTILHKIFLITCYVNNTWKLYYCWWRNSNVICSKHVTSYYQLNYFLFFAFLLSIYKRQRMQNELKWEGFNVPFNTFHVISEVILAANLLTEAFSTSHLTDIYKTKHNYNEQQHKNLNNHARTLLTYSQTKANKTRCPMTSYE